MITEPVRVVEGENARLSDIAMQQVICMNELMGDDGVFELLNTPNGCMVSVKDCIGQVDFRNGESMIIAPNLSVTGVEIPPQQMLIEMIYRIFDINTAFDVVDNLFEFFVRLFIDSVNRLIMRGLRSKYHLVQGNEKAFKGRIMFSENIRENYIHKERIYVEYEIYSQNRPENRLIKRTLEAVLRRTHDSRNIKGAKTLLLGLEEIDSSMDIARDFSMCIMDRNMTDYVSPMMWCDVFLNGMGLANSSKGTLSYALMVRTESIFSAYVARMSTKDRMDGSFSLKYHADIRNDGNIGGTSVIFIDLDWSFFDKGKGARLTDAESLYLSAPGYRGIPPVNGSRVKAMAGNYLSDLLARC